MIDVREPLPPGAVSRIRGHYQAPALRALQIFVLLTAVGGMVGSPLAALAVGVVVATPLARVGWLAIRWVNERDWAFVTLAIALLSIIAIGTALATTT